MRFGRCGYFVLTDPEKKETTAIRNPAGEASGGAGIRAAQEIIKCGADVLLSGNIGPNAHRVLAAAGVEVYELKGDTVAAAVEKFSNGELSKLTEPNSSAHSGPGRGQGKGMRRQ
jgi:predicted Fe-Mo cluster-binding NifX family protein